MQPRKSTTPIAQSHPNGHACRVQKPQGTSLNPSVRGPLTFKLGMSVDVTFTSAQHKTVPACQFTTDAAFQIQAPCP